MSDWKKESAFSLAAAEVMINQHTDAIDRLSVVCTDLAKSIADINTTQQVAMQILRNQQTQIDEHRQQRERDIADVKAQTSKLFATTDEHAKTITLFSGSKMAVIAGLAMLGWILTTGISAYAAYAATKHP